MLIVPPARDARRPGEKFAGRRIEPLHNSAATSHIKDSEPSHTPVRVPTMGLAREVIPDRQADPTPAIPRGSGSAMGWGFCWGQPARTRTDDYGHTWCESPGQQAILWTTADNAGRGTRLLLIRGLLVRVQSGEPLTQAARTRENNLARAAFGFPVHFRASRRSSGIRSNHDPCA